MLNTCNLPNFLYLPGKLISIFSDSNLIFCSASCNFFLTSLIFISNSDFKLLTCAPNSFLFSTATFFISRIKFLTSPFLPKNFTLSSSSFFKLSTPSSKSKNFFCKSLKSNNKINLHNFFNTKLKRYFIQKKSSCQKIITFCFR